MSLSNEAPSRSLLHTDVFLSCFQFFIDFQDAPPGKPFRTDISNEGGSYGLRQGIDSRVDDRNFSDNRGSRAPPDNRQFMNRDNYNTYGGPPSGGLPGNQFSGNQVRTAFMWCQIEAGPSRLFPELYGNFCRG